MSAGGELPGVWEESDLSGGRVDSDDMSARERLIRSVYQKLSQNQMEQLVDAFAHELAEKLRKQANVFGMFRSEDMRMRAEGLRVGADLIDPMKGGTDG